MAISGEHWDTRIGRRIRLRDLHVLLTVVQRGSMAKAAQHLSITQPAVSKSIADLEHALGVRLLDRSPQGIEPTTYGNALVRRSLSVFDELRQGVGEIEFMADPRVGEVRVGCPETLAATLLPAIIERLSAQHPGIRLHIIQTNPCGQKIRTVDEPVGRSGIGKLTGRVSWDNGSQRSSTASRSPDRRGGVRVQDRALGARDRAAS
jgi:molybdenum-dependent DNA-binding transcriptional regulator ModE